MTCELNDNIGQKNYNAAVEEMFPRIQQALSRFRLRTSSSSVNQKKEDLSSTTALLQKERNSLSLLRSKSFPKEKEQNDPLPNRAKNENKSPKQNKTTINSQLSTSPPVPFGKDHCLGSTKISKGDLMELAESTIVLNRQINSRPFLKKNSQFLKRARDTDLKNTLNFLKNEVDSFIEFNGKESERIYRNAENQFRCIFHQNDGISANNIHEKIDKKQQDIEDQGQRGNKFSGIDLMTKSNKKMHIQGLGKRIREKRRHS